MKMREKYKLLEGNEIKLEKTQIFQRNWIKLLSFREKPQACRKYNKYKIFERNWIKTKWKYKLLGEIELILVENLRETEQRLRENTCPRMKLTENDPWKFWLK